MSAPTPAGGEDSPVAGYYPDPSIPGYVRYWNGAAWVPGTSRPAPRTGEVMPPVPGQAARAAAPRVPAPKPVPDSAPKAAPGSRPEPGAVAPAPAGLEETGPVFIDEEPSDEPSRPEPATAWQADTSRQTGFGTERDHRVSWGDRDPRAPGAAPGGPADPRLPAQGADPAGGALPGVRPAGATAAPTAGPRPAVPTAGPQAEGAAVIRPGRPPEDAGPPVESTMTIRPVRSRDGEGPGRPGPGGAPGQPPAHPQGPAPGVRAAAPGPAAPPVSQPQPQPQPHPQPQTHARHPAPPHAQPHPPARPQPSPGPVTPGPGGGSASWAQQVHRLAQPDEGPPQREPQPVIPWKPPVSDPFLRAAQEQAAAKPAGLGRRFAARLIDTLVLGALTAAVAVPMALRARDHIDAKIEAARHSGRTVTVWLVDGTTAVHLGVVVAALLILGTLYEALPTARWGRTLGKKLCGLRVVGIESHEPPPFGAALRRWLVHGVLGLLVVGVVNLLWALFDRPWRQCWHDKAARTFVTGG
ncbi:RDD family protein [Streptomyces jumonjinensis]|uniref:RDD family protein n=1 Tax=Streptomyces jumonjinensis TaxID=1945 RepID=UPI0037AD4F4E